MKLVNINKNFELESPENFWVQNPQLSFMEPFASFYDEDESVGASESSRAMWVIIFMLDPDEETNKFFRIPKKERKQMLIKNLAPKLDWENDLFQQCYKAYPDKCMSAVEVALMIHIESMQERAVMIRDTDLTLDKTVVSPQGKSYVNKGTALQINTLQKDFPKLMQTYEELQAKFIKQKEEARVKGNVQLAAHEQDSFWD